MSNKSGTSSQVITLPRGGGALQGLGETFAPDLFTGTGNFNVPLALPSGRNGFQPELSLVYSTGHPNGPFGLGWDLSIPSVSRKTSKGVPRYRDDGLDSSGQDTFVLSGMDDLVQLSESQPGIKKFRPKTERLFADIEHIRNGTHNSWRVRSRDGLVSVFGTAALAEDAAVIADPSNPSKIFCWKLINTTDSFGNRIEFQYLRDRGQDGSHRWDQLYLERIQYVDFDRDGATRFLVSVMFAYEPRPDPFSNYRSGFDIRTRLRCTRIEIRTNAVEDLLVRIYQMVYLDDRVAAGELPIATRPLNSVSLLSQIRMQGHDRGETEQLPPLEFGYTRFDPARRRFQPLTAGGESMPARSLGNEDFELVDLFGNGLPDIVHR